MSSSMRCRSALTGRSTDETGIGCSSHDEGNSMLERQLRPVQDFIETAPRHPQHQSREAGSCMGAKLNGRSIGRMLPVWFRLAAPGGATWAATAPSYAERPFAKLLT